MENGSALSEDDKARILNYLQDIYLLFTTVPNDPDLKLTIQPELLGSALAKIINPAYASPNINHSFSLLSPVEYSAIARLWHQSQEAQDLIKRGRELKLLKPNTSFAKLICDGLKIIDKKAAGSQPGHYAHQKGIVQSTEAYVCPLAAIAAEYFKTYGTNLVHLTADDVDNFFKDLEQPIQKSDDEVEVLGMYTSPHQQPIVDRGRGRGRGRGRDRGRGSRRGQAAGRPLVEHGYRCLRHGSNCRTFPAPSSNIPIGIRRPVPRREPTTQRYPNGSVGQRMAPPTDARHIAMYFSQSNHMARGQMPTMDANRYAPHGNDTTMQGGCH